jgi:hypothetical protein
MFIGDGRVVDEKESDERVYHAKLGHLRIPGAGQISIPDMVSTSPDPLCNNTDTRSSKPNQASSTPDSSYPFVRFTLFASSSPISLFLVLNLTIIGEH